MPTADDLLGGAQESGQSADDLLREPTSKAPGWAQPQPSWGDYARSLVSPSNFVEQLKSNFGGAVEGFRNPSATTQITLAAPGAATLPGAAARLSAFAAGHLIDQPPQSFSQGVETAGKAIFDPARPWTSPATWEAAIPLAGKLIPKIWRSAPDLPKPPGLPAPGATQVAKDYAAQLGQNIEQATGGLLKARTPAELDALVYGQQGPGGKLATGRRALGDFYESKVTDAASALSRAPGRGQWSPSNLQALGGDQVLVPALGGKPMSLAEAIDEIKNIGPQYSGTNPALRTQVGAPTRAARARAWSELEQYLGQAEPSGAANAAIKAARDTFAIGTNFLDAVRKSGAIVRRPNDISFDSAKFQEYVAKNRAQFINAFDNNGTPGAWNDFVRLVFHGGAVGTRDVLSRNTTGITDAAAQLLRHGGGAGTTAVLPVRSLLPGLGNQWTGTAPYTMGAVPPGVQTLTDLAASNQGVRINPDLYREGR